MCIERSVSVCAWYTGGHTHIAVGTRRNKEELGGQFIVSVSSRDAAEG